MFPWDKKSTGRFYSKQSYLPPTNRENKGNMSAFIEHKTSSNELPPINQRHNISYDNHNQSILTQDMGESIDTPEEYNNEQGLNGGTNHHRSQSQAPMLPQISKRIASVGQQKQYAKILLDQIKARKQQKANEKLMNYELDRKMLAGGDFYKHFGGNKIKEKYIDKALGVYESDYSRNQVTRRTETNLTQGSPDRDRHQLMPPEERMKSEESHETRNEEMTEPNQTIPVENRSFEEIDEETNQKTKELVRKLEYQKALEKQILEQNMRKQHEKELAALHDKLEELQESYYRLKSKPVKENSTIYKKTQNEKPSSNIPIIIHAPNGTKQHFDALQNMTTMKPPTAKKSTVNAFNRSKSSIRSSQERQDSYGPNENTLQPPIRKVQQYVKEPEQDQYLLDYLQLQDELGKIKDEVRNHIFKMNEKLGDIRTELRHPMHYPIVNNGIPYHMLDQYLHPPSIQAREDSMSRTRRSLPHETEFIPVTEASIQNPYPKYGFIPNVTYVVPVGQNNTNNEKTPSQYDTLLNNMINLGKKLEQSIFDQQQKMDKDLNALQSEIRSLRKNNTSNSPQPERIYVAHSKTNPLASDSKIFSSNGSQGLQADLMEARKDFFSPARPMRWSINPSIEEYEIRDSGKKFRRSSQHIRFYKRGIKRKRTELPKDLLKK